MLPAVSSSIESKVLGESESINAILSIVTVVKDDLAGLRSTLESAAALVNQSYEHWVIDGSNGTEVREFLERVNSVKWISEPDVGLYDAMNKGLERAAGCFLLFLNAGDRISSSLEAALLFARLSTESRVLIGHTIERHGELRWLRPGLGHERDIFSAPAHQATFYPRVFYASHRYDIKIRVAADGEYTRRAIRECGAAYLPFVISEFGLGGLSSNYRSWRGLRLRLAETGTTGQRSRLVAKFILWHCLPRRAFYSLLAANKYTRIRPNQTVKLAALDLSTPKN